ncbi:MAG: hypothetical protein IJV62_01235 [Eggerthellaceae bacterium]|nr:hypothetical protein [Eggerthellaceae bacterium]
MSENTSIQEGVSSEENVKEETSHENLAAADSRVYTQKELDEIVKHAVQQRVNRANKKHAEEVDSLKKQIDKAQQKADISEQELIAFRAEKEAEENKLFLAREWGVPAHLIKGETEFERFEHAKELAHALKQAPVVPFVQSDGFASSQDVKKTTGELFAEALDGVF